MSPVEVLIGSYERQSSHFIDWLEALFSAGAAAMIHTTHREVMLRYKSFEPAMQVTYSLKVKEGLEEMDTGSL